MPGHDGVSGLPKPMLKPQSTQTMSTSEKPVNAMSMVLTTHLRWTSPP
jgi:hypothetical protein